MRVCLVYDCLFPYTVGGAERWYRDIARRLAADGHEVTYLTLRQWPRNERAEVEGVDVIPVGPRMALYVGDRRRILPPLVFGAGVLWHLLRHGGRYDVVHTASFPYFSLLAAGLLRRLRRFRLVVDWHEVWSLGYWREYLGAAGGTVGWLVQLLCTRFEQRAFCPSRLQAERLRAEGLRGEPTVLDGRYVGSLEPSEPAQAEPVVVFAGRLIPEKRAPAIVPAVVRAAGDVPGLRGEVFGDGPDRDRVRAAAEASGGLVAWRGFVDADVLEAALARALCMLFPSRREGYGLVVVEASSRGVPTIVVREPDNAATELVEEGENGTIAPSASPQDLAAAIVRVAQGGQALRERTREWFRRNAHRVSLERSIEQVLAAYRAGP